MTRRRKILGSIAIIAVVAIGALAFALSYNSPCAAPAAIPEGAQRMTAVVARCYGSPDVLSVETVAKPTPADNQILVKIQAASVNPYDWHMLRGSPYLMRLSAGIGTPQETRVGRDFAGTVETVGKNVTRFKVGDAVFGGTAGTLAEYVTVRETAQWRPSPTA